MEVQQASATALSVAYMRAYHYLYDDAPKIFEDVLAQRLLTAAEWETITRRYAAALSRLDPARAQACPDDQAKARAYLHLQCTPPQALSRARYTEDKLLDALRRGVTQYVLVGAGLDSFAWRRPDLQTAVQMFEVDHPASQAFKRQRLTDIGLPLPPHLHLVAADLAQEDLAHVLRHAAYNPQQPAFFSWLGVTMYLEPAAFATTLRAIHSVAAVGSELVFDYYDLEAFDPEKVSARMRLVFENVRRQGEPNCTGLDPQTLPAVLAGVGFRLREHVHPADIQARYFQGRTDEYTANEHAHFAWAVVA
jgi:methyltransferase (TIGR00027 family)